MVGDFGQIFVFDGSICAAEAAPEGSASAKGSTYIHQPSLNKTRNHIQNKQIYMYTQPIICACFEYVYTLSFKSTCCEVFLRVLFGRHYEVGNGK